MTDPGVSTRKNGGPRALPLVGFVATFAVAACGTPQTAGTEENPFDGKTLREVVAAIGPPAEQSPTEAVWTYEERHTYYIWDDVIITNTMPTGWKWRERLYTCTFRATLKRGRVVASSYLGGDPDCDRYRRPKG